MQETLVILLLILAIAVIFPARCKAETLKNNCLRSKTPDPWLFTDGEYYYLTMTGSISISVLKAKQLSKLTYADAASAIAYSGVIDPTVKELFGEDAELSGTWSPEIHYFSEENYPGNSGWYMFLGLRKKLGDSSQVKMVVLKSLSGKPNGPYGHPVTGEESHSQPVLGPDGQIWNKWGVGMSSVTIPSGEYRGCYSLFVSETGRGQSGADGLFYQMIQIAKMKNPWTMEKEPEIIMTPTQEWEYAGSSITHPRVVEGATAVYGDRGDVYMTYSGSGFWSDYGLGQLTWNGGDPMLASSWVKLEVKNGNPFFQANTSETLRGAGHACFLKDQEGNRFLCYHAYPLEDGVKSKSRSAYIDPYFIDYTRWNGVSWGVLTAGPEGSGIPETGHAVIFVDEK